MTSLHQTYDVGGHRLCPVFQHELRMLAQPNTDSESAVQVGSGFSRIYRDRFDFLSWSTEHGTRRAVEYPLPLSRLGAGFRWTAETPKTLSEEEHERTQPSNSSKQANALVSNNSSHIRFRAPARHQQGSGDDQHNRHLKTLRI